MITELWLIGLGIGLLVVIIVVILLLGIIFQTKRIIKLAGVALNEVNQIEKNTLSIWKLNQTNIHTEKISNGFEEMEGVLVKITGKEKIQEAS